MGKLYSRQVHLDFHTSEFMPGVGEKFSKENFQKSLKIGNVNSITVFAKCHHSWCYYPTKVGMMHPTLTYDLTGAMIEAAHDVGVRAPIYITAGWSAKDADAHPEWIARNKDGSLQLTNFDLDAKPEQKKPIVSWKPLCLAGCYAQHIYDLTTEICERYPVVDGLFYDICFINDQCYCDSCVEGMKKQGLNPEKEEEAKKYYILMRRRFMTVCTDILKKKHSDATVFFNGGANYKRPEYHDLQTHFELEDLPTTWGGYDKMPFRAKYFARYGKDYLGMTGKFHTMWGEFGGFKAIDALRYECAMMLVYGARCSIGDQMHPCGEMDLETYLIIGEAYKYVESMEPWAYNVEETTRLGMFLSSDKKSDEGLVKILLEKQLDFDIIMNNDPLEHFDTIILPDCVSLDTETADRINEYVSNGGSVLLTGTSGLDAGKSKFILDVGASYQGPSLYENDYVQFGEQVNVGICTSPILFYEGAQQISVKDASILATIKEPYFNRTYGHYCSHQNTPYKLEDAPYPAAIRKGNVIYLAHPVCRIYFDHGAQFHRDYFVNALNLLYQSPVLTIDMPSSGRARFLKQPDKKRYILHVLYATPIQRGRAMVIEDLPPLYDINAKVNVVEKVRSVYLAPQGEKIAFVQDVRKVSFTIPIIKAHQAVVLEY